MSGWIGPVQWAPSADGPAPPAPLPPGTRLPRRAGARRRRRRAAGPGDGGRLRARRALGRRARAAHHDLPRALRGRRGGPPDRALAVDRPVDRRRRRPAPRRRVEASGGRVTHWRGDGDGPRIGARGRRQPRGLVPPGGRRPALAPHAGPLPRAGGGGPAPGDSGGARGPLLRALHRALAHGRRPRRGRARGRAGRMARPRLSAPRAEPPRRGADRRRGGLARVPHRPAGSGPLHRRGDPLLRRRGGRAAARHQRRPRGRTPFPGGLAGRPGRWMGGRAGGHGPGPPVVHGPPAAMRRRLPSAPGLSGRRRRDRRRSRSPPAAGSRATRARCASGAGCSWARWPSLGWASVASDPDAAQSLVADGLARRRGGRLLRVASGP